MPLITLPPHVHSFAAERWEVKRERLDAAWTPLRDEKGRAVHGWALIEETPSHMLGRELKETYSRWSIPAEPFVVMLVATRDGKAFGATPRSSRFATREEAIAHAVKALAQQGKRYAKKYGGAS